MGLGCDHEQTCAVAGAKEGDSPTENGQLRAQRAERAHSHDAHDLHHDHSVALRTQNRKTLQIAMAITSTVLIAEVIGAWFSGSLALLADVGHMFTDLGGLALAFFASRISEAASTRVKTYGYLRTEILAALTNGVVLVGLSAVIAYLAFERFRDPPPVLGGVMFFVASIGLVANLICGVVLYRGSQHNLNVRAAFLHVASDALGSIGAIIAALGIQLLGWMELDAIMALLIAVLILYSAWRVVQESVDVLMESTPKHVDLDRLREEILATDGVVAVHDLHVWTLTSGYYALSAHVDVRAERASLPILRALVALAQERYAIAHTTFQLEERSETRIAEHTEECVGEHAVDSRAICSTERR